MVCRKQWMMKAVSLNACVAQNGIPESVVVVMVVVMMRVVVDLVHCMVVVVVAHGHCKSRPSHFGAP